MYSIEYALLAVLLLNVVLLAVITRELRRRLAPPETRPRVILPMSSGTSIKVNTSAQITSRPQLHSFRPERIVIGGTPGDWVVNDIKIHGVSQFAQSGDVPGEMFASEAMDAFVRFDTVEVARDVQIVVTYVGSADEGAPFVCGILGTAVAPSRSRPTQDRDRRVASRTPGVAAAA